MAQLEEFTFDVEQDKRQRATEEQRYQTSDNAEEASGLTTDTADRQKQIERALDETARDANQDETSQVEYLKKQLGKQGQELGDLRRSAKEAELLRQRLAALEQTARQAQAQQTPQGSVDIFADIPQDQSYMSPLERQRLNQVIVAMANATQSEMERRSNDLLYTALRTTAGVSDAEEAEILADNPWINSLAGRDRASAIAKMAESVRNANEAPKKAAEEAARLAARRSSFVESSSRTSSESTDSMEPAIEKLLRAARSGQFKNADEMEKAFRKVGIPRVDSYGMRR